MPDNIGMIATPMAMMADLRKGLKYLPCPLEVLLVYALAGTQPTR